MSLPISKKLSALTGVAGAIWAIQDAGNPWVLGAKALAIGIAGAGYLYAQGSVDKALALSRGYSPATGKPSAKDTTHWDGSDVPKND